MFQRLLADNIRQGILNLHLPEGQSYRFGTRGPEVHWVINQPGVIQRIAEDWEFQLGETYMSGGWDVAHCTLVDLLTLLRINFSEPAMNRWLIPFIRFQQQWNRVSRSYRNVAHHYDQTEELFNLILDNDLHYSCAYFTREELTLNEAQQQKCHHIAKKLLLRPGQKILDIGCGFGSLALALAAYEQVEVTGITLSELQLKIARRRARENKTRNVNFKFEDYRQHKGHYDRIVSVGMFEHVGKPYYQTYFQQIKNMLTEDGIALVHTIGRSSPPKVVNPWIRKYIFPGGGIPSLSEVSRSIENNHLMLTDVEILRLHYAKTLQFWLQNLQANRNKIIQLRGDRFFRMWEFYYAVSEIAFMHSDLVVFQLQLARKHHVVPITRDYLYSC